MAFINIPSLVTKYFVVQKISPGQTFMYILNPGYDLYLEHSNPIFFTGHSSLCCTTKPSLVANRSAVKRI